MIVSACFHADELLSTDLKSIPAKLFMIKVLCQKILFI